MCRPCSTRWASDAAGRRVREYSKGMRQRLGFAQALLGTPRLLFLDEPTTGLDPGAIRDFYRILRELKGEGVTMVLTSHILAEIQERVDRLAIMEGGQIRATGTVQALREAMNLPLTLEIAGACRPARAGRRALEGLAIESIEESGTCCTSASPATPRCRCWQRLATLGDTLRDLHVREPSLEDVFFGYRA
jgi:Cu-processing system ATP-binding protein